MRGSGAITSTSRLVLKFLYALCFWTQKSLLERPFAYSILLQRPLTGISLARVMSSVKAFFFISVAKSKVRVSSLTRNVSRRHEVHFPFQHGAFTEDYIFCKGPDTQDAGFLGREAGSSLGF